VSRRHELLTQAGDEAARRLDEVTKVRELKFPKLKERVVGQGVEAGVNKPVTGEVRMVWGESDINEGNISAGCVAYITAGALHEYADFFLPYFRICELEPAAIVHEWGGKNDHWSVAAKEWGLPVVVGLGDTGLIRKRLTMGQGNFDELVRHAKAPRDSLSETMADTIDRLLVKNGDEVTVYGGTVYDGAVPFSEFEYSLPKFDHDRLTEIRKNRQPWLTQVMLNLAFPESLHRYRESVDLSDGAGFVRTEFQWIRTCEGLHPIEYIKQHGREPLIDKLKEEFRRITHAFGGKDPNAKMVWFRTQDMGSDFLRGLK